MRRRQCAASSMPTSGRLSATASSASRVATSRIDGRVATTLAARGARERSAISPKSAPLTSRASTTGGCVVFVARAAQHLELAARDDVRLRALFPSSMTQLPGGHGDHLERADELAQRLLAERAEERQRRGQQQLGRRRPPRTRAVAAWTICVAFEVSAGPVRKELSGWKSSKCGSGGGGVSPSREPRRSPRRTRAAT